MRCVGYAGVTRRLGSQYRTMPGITPAQPHPPRSRKMPGIRPRAGGLMCRADQPATDAGEPRRRTSGRLPRQDARAGPQCSWPERSSCVPGHAGPRPCFPGTRLRKPQQRVAQVGAVQGAGIEERREHRHRRCHRVRGGGPAVASYRPAACPSSAIRSRASRRSRRMLAW